MDPPPPPSDFHPRRVPSDSSTTSSSTGCTLPTPDLRPTFSAPLFLLLPLLLLCAALSLPPSRTTRLLPLAALTALFLAALRTSAHDPPTDYLNGFLLSSLWLLGVQYLLLREPWHTARYERGRIAGAPAALSAPLRLWWAACLVLNVRGIGWSHQVRHVPPRVARPRTRFVIRALGRALASYAAADALNVCTRRLGFTLARIHALSAPGQLLHIAAFVGLTAALADVQYWVCAAGGVALGLGRAEDWPPVYGRLRDACTLRGFWGKVWHQNLRRLVSPPGQRLARALGFAPGTWQSSYTQLYTAFVLSGLIHSAGDVLVAPAYAFTSLPFFLVQALGITAEDAVLALGRRVGVGVGVRRVGKADADVNKEGAGEEEGKDEIEATWWARALGYIWVFCWAGVTFASYRDLSIRAGWVWSADWPLSPASVVLKEVEGWGWGWVGAPVSGAGWTPREL